MRPKIRGALVRNRRKIHLMLGGISHYLWLLHLLLYFKIVKKGDLSGHRNFVILHRILKSATTCPC